MTDLSSGVRVAEATPREQFHLLHQQCRPGSAFLLTEAVKSYRSANSGKPVEIGLLSNDTVRIFVRGFDSYDPRFGAAFHDGTWNAGFDHAAALQKITCPTLLLQANFTVQANGTLDGTMSQEEADRAMALLPHGQYMKIDATHVINLDKPEVFTLRLENFFLSLER